MTFGSQIRLIDKRRGFGFAGLLEPLRSRETTSKKIWEAVQTLFSARNEIQELMAVRLGSKTTVMFTSPVYASMLPALQIVYAVMVLIAESSEPPILMAAPKRELEPKDLRLLRSELAGFWADISHALRGFHALELVDVLIVLDGVLCWRI